MRRALLPTLLVLLMAAPAAHAGGRVTVLHAGPIGGPRFAGSDVVWATRTAPGQFTVERMAPDGTRTPLGTFGSSPLPYLTLAASPERVSVSALERQCFGGCKYQNFQTIFSSFVTGPIGGPLEQRSACAGTAACYRAECNAPLSATGHAVYLAPCDNPIRVIRDFSEGRDYPAPNLGDVKLAGRFVAGRRLGQGNGGSIVIADWRSGEEVASVPYEPILYGSPPSGLALQPDGKVAFPIPRPGGFELAWASPAEPYPHPLGVKSRELYPFAMAADRVAYVRRDDPALNGGPVGVVGLDGNGTTPRIDAPAADFDGRRVIGLQRPCGAHVLAEWDLAGDPPQVPPGRCPAAKARPASTRLDPNRVLRLAVTCPAEPALGCRGGATIRGRPVWRRDPSGERKVAFDLDAGETQTLSATVWWSSICHARGGKATLDVRTTSGGSEGRDHPAGVSSARFRVSNVGPLPRACRKRR